MEKDGGEAFLLLTENKSATTELVNGSKFEIDLIEPVKATNIFSMEKVLSLHLLIFTVVVSFIANGLILWAIRTSKYFRRPMNLMIANLVLASMTQVTFFGAIYAIKRHPVFVPKTCGAWTCGVLFVVARIPQPAEVFSVLCVALDRIRVVKNPLDSETSLRAKKKIILVWLAAIMAELPLGTAWAWKEKAEMPFPDKPYFPCFNTRLIFGSRATWICYITAYLLFVYVIPSAYLLHGLFRIVVILKCVLQAPCKTYLKTIDRHDILSINAGRKREAIRNAILFIGIFILAKLPCGIWWAAYNIPDGLKPERFKEWQLWSRPVYMTVMLSHLALYPFLIFSLSGDIRKFYSNFCRCRKSVRREAFEVTDLSD